LTELQLFKLHSLNAFGLLLPDIKVLSGVCHFCWLRYLLNYDNAVDIKLV